jgi:8-amino-7-oxononanoate synthase
METQRSLLQENAEYMRVCLKKLGFDTASSSTQIIPIILGSAEAALTLSSYLEESGFYVPAIRPPTVPEGSSRLRVSLSAVHTKDQIDDFLKLLRKWHEKKN